MLKTLRLKNWSKYQVTPPQTTPLVSRHLPGKRSNFGRVYCGAGRRMRPPRKCCGRAMFRTAVTRRRRRHDRYKRNARYAPDPGVQRVRVHGGITKQKRTRATTTWWAAAAAAVRQHSTVVLARRTGCRVPARLVRRAVGRFREVTPFGWVSVGRTGRRERGALLLAVL